MIISQADKARIVVKWLAEQKGVSMAAIGEMVGYNSASAWSQSTKQNDYIAESQRCSRFSIAVFVNAASI